VVARALVTLLTGSTKAGPIHNHMKRLDHAAPKDSKARYKVAAFAKLLAEVFPDKSANHHAVMALAERAAKKWERTIEPLRLVDWRVEIMSKKVAQHELARFIVNKVWR